MHMAHTVSVTVSLAEPCLSCGGCHLMLQSAKGTFFFSVSSQHGRRSTSCRSSIERWCWVEFTLLFCRIYAEEHSNDIHSSPVLNGLLPLGCSKSRPHWKRRLLDQSGQVQEKLREESRLLVSVGHSLSRALSDTSCGTPYNLPNLHHVALFIFLARSRATNMHLCPDYPYNIQ